VSRPPSAALLAIEGRMVLELAALGISLPLLQRAPRGDGHGVLVMPGFMASDVSTLPLRGFLRGRGLDAQPWRLGRNLGPVPGMLPRLQRRLREERERTGRRVSLIGWSLGGLYARELARAWPDDVRQVITLGTPFAGNPRANHAWRLFELLSGLRLDEMDPGAFWARSQPLSVPTTAIYSRSDGITAWECCVEQEGPQRESIEVGGSHLGLGHNPLALHAIADRLAQAEGNWQPFQRSGMLRYLYPQPRRVSRVYA
jgi:pimeloyl-ACP methyl ester carboxylesterase